MSERHLDNPSEDSIRYFCDNINLGYTDEAFMLRLESGATKLAFTMTPEHAKRLMLALTRYVSEFEEEHRRVRAEWPPKIESPYSSKELAIPPQAIDELYPAVMEYVIKSRHASVSRLQRKFNIGYSRSALLIDLLEENKVIGPSEGTKPRAILIPHEKPVRKKK
jgi:DNA segregation ATPase FtsK/SpoIIIE-like protein